MKKITSLLIGLFLVLSCSQEETFEETQQDSNSQQLLSIKEINSFIDSELKKGNQNVWSTASAEILWSAAMHSDQVISVGFGDKNKYFSENRSAQEIHTIKELSAIVENSEETHTSETHKFVDEKLNVMYFTVYELATIKLLLKRNDVRYLEPIGYASYANEQQKSAGCSQDNQTINSNDFRVVSPNARVPWNYDIHNIPDAWGLSTGKGITVGLIDTGLSPNQALLGSKFNDGASSGKRVERFGTFVDSFWWWSRTTDGPDDKCGHGTQMGAVIASPRNDEFMPVGVAYNANLVAYRGTGDVVINGYHEQRGVSNALRALADRSDVKVISMSIGWIFTIGNVRDAIKYAHSKGKMIIAAGGTSTPFTNFVGVIFPASMSETVAVTGISDNGYKKCNICHEGSRIDFTLVMQRASDARRNVPALGFTTGSQTYVSGSSVATAMTAGIAALVWARNPSMTRNQVLDKLRRAGDFYPNRNSKFGYGNIDALKAVQ